MVALLLQSLPLLNQSYHGGTANVRLWMRLTGQPGHAGMLGGAILVLLGLALLAALLHLGRRGMERRLRGDGEQADPAAPSPGGRLAEETFEALVELEAAHRRGELSQEAYQAQKGLLMDELARQRRSGPPLAQ